MIRRHDSGLFFPYVRQSRVRQTELAGGAEHSQERPPQTERINWAGRYPNEIILHGPSANKEIALTFDDGPDDVWTPQVLDVLREMEVRATFFLVGNRVENHPDITRRIVREGHIVGNHSWDHPNLAKLSAAQVRSQLVRTNETLQRTVGVRPRLFRPPYGSLSEAAIQEAVALQMKIILWNVDSLDWMPITAEQIATNILSHTGPGSIILMHSAGGEGQSLQNTVNALPYVISTLKNRSLVFRTIPELLGFPAYLT